jgi:uncharacterized membrane protein (DUF2068 family)
MQEGAKRRPVGVSIIAVLMWIGGVALIIVALLTMQHRPVASVVDLVFSIASIVVGWGLWSLKHWAYWAAVILQILGILSSIYTFSTNSSVGLLAFGLALHGVVLIYLFTSSQVRKAFRT